MTKIIDPGLFVTSSSGLISQKKQFNDPYLDLTVGKIYRIKSSGRLDFGGSEYQPGNVEPVFPVKRTPEDSYGWWEMHEGYFLIQFNETIDLPEAQIGILQAHPHLLSTGCLHPTLTVHKIDKDFRIPLWVPKIGVQIKENARLSQLLVIAF